MQVVVHADLFEDDLLLHVEVVLAEAGVDQRGEQFHRGVDVLGEKRTVIEGDLFAGRGVIVRTDLVEDAVDVVGRVFFVPLEGHVFEEVTDAGDVGGFIARAGTDEVADGEAVCVGIEFGDDLQAVVEFGFMKDHGAPPAVWGRSLRR